MTKGILRNIAIAGFVILLGILVFLRIYSDYFTLSPFDRTAAIDMPSFACSNSD